MKKRIRIVREILVGLAALCLAVSSAGSSPDARPGPQLTEGEISNRIRNQVRYACHEGLNRYKDRNSQVEACKEAVKKIPEVADVELYGHVVTIEFKDPKRFMHIRIYLTTNADGTKRIGPAGTGTPQ